MAFPSTYLLISEAFASEAPPKGVIASGIVYNPIALRRFSTKLS
ncbi:hypothetical protein [Allocoleopsis sp.]